MEKTEQNRTPVLEKNSYEEIGQIPETVIDSLVIDEEERIEEDSIINIDNIKDSEEISDNIPQTFKAFTIIDELEDGISRGSSSDKSLALNIGKLASRINNLTFIRKKKKPVIHKKQPKEIKKPIADDITYRYDNGPEEILIDPVKENEFFSKIIRETDQETEEKIPEETAKDEIQLSATENEEYNETIEVKEKKPDIIFQEQEQETEKSGHGIHENTEKPEVSEQADTTAIKTEIEKNERSKVEENEEEIEKPATAITQEEEHAKKEKIKTKSKSESESEKSNFLSIEIPDKLLNKIPNNFNIDELGKIDLNEAEIIASEDILSLTKGEIIEGLEDLDIFTPDKNAKLNPVNISDESVQEEIISNKHIAGVPGKGPVAEKHEEKIIKQEEQPAEIVKEDVKDKLVKSADEIVTQESRVNESLKQPIEEEKKRDDSYEDDSSEDNSYEDEGFSLIDEIEINEEEEVLINTIADPEKKEGPEKHISANTMPVEKKAALQKNEEMTSHEYIPQNEINNKNVYFINSENRISGDTHDYIFDRDELEDLSSSILDSTNGMSRQLIESDSKDGKTITRLIRDNYPTFVDLLKETEEKPKYFTDDIDFIDSSFINKNNISFVQEDREDLEYIEQGKSTSYEMATGLIPEEIKLIENQLFNLHYPSADEDETIEKIAGLDQHPDDTIALSDYKYIMPFPESLNETEKKSIEGDISGNNALILEEDVEKIKKKLEDSMKKKIEETIQDITDKIIIYEENKKNNNEGITDKEDIRKLLIYLNELFDKLPEESVKDFADSEYYNLYKKVIKNMEI